MGNKARNKLKLVWAVILVLALAGCSGKAKGKEGAGDLVVKVTGSTTLVAMTEDIASGFESANAGSSVEIQGVGSSAGVKAVNDGTADVGTCSRELKGGELDYGLTQYTVAYDGIVICVNPANPVSSLDSEAVRKIFSGEIRNWSEVGGNDAKIIVVSREEGSGTRTAFEEMLGIEDLFDVSLISEGNGAVKGAISTKENAIGYISLGVADKKVKMLDIDAVTPTVETIKSGEYPVSRALYYFTKGEVSPATQQFIDYALSAEGQEFVKEHFVPVNYSNSRKYR